MYEITCESCGQVGFHPSRVAAETRAETHMNESGHDCFIKPMEDA